VNNYGESSKLPGDWRDQKKSSDLQRNPALVYDKIGDMERDQGNLDRRARNTTRVWSSDKT
jgi:hypothetical protein